MTEQTGPLGCKSHCPIDKKVCQKAPNSPYHGCDRPGHPKEGHTWFQFTREAPF